MIALFAKRLVAGLLVALIAVGSQLFLPVATSIATADVPPSALTPSLTLAGYSGDNGFVVTVANYDAAYTWNLSATQGSLTFRQPTNGNPFSISVRNLPLDSSATLTVTASRAGYPDGSASIVGYSKSAALTPAFSEVTPLAYGFSFRVTNYDPDFGWATSGTPGLNITIDSTGLVTATNAYTSNQYTVTVTTTKTGFVTGTNSSFGRALALSPALTPELSSWTKTTSTMTAQIINYSADYSWTIDSQNQGTATISDSGLISIIGLRPGHQVPMTITSSRYAYAVGVLNATESSLNEALVPEFDSPTQTDDGFSTFVTNYDNNFNWSAETSAGEVFFDSDGTLLVTGLQPGESATITVSNDNPDYEPGVATITSSANQVALNPLFGTPTRNQTGYTVQITNFDPAFVWWVVTELLVGQATIDANGLVTVAGLNPGQYVMVIVGTTRTGYPDGQADLTAAALEAVPIVDPPVVDPPAVTPDSSGDSTDAGDGDIDTAAVSRAESAAREAAEALAQARIKSALDEVIKAKADAEAAQIAKAAEAVALKLAGDLKAAAMVETASSAKLPRVISRLTPAQVSLIPLGTFKRLSPVLVKTLKTSQVAGLTAAQVKSLSTQLLSKLSPAAIGSLQPEVLGALSVAKLKALTTSQVKAIWAAQILQLDPDQRKAIRR